ncbi:MAG: nuclear transport factor 2 family protein [Muribaculaceae bacterium]|nr:nuclear transport factor 2 family protein [Muribaculaceae bacterium]
MNFRFKAFFSLLMICALSLSAQVEVEVIDGLDNPQMKSTIESNASRFLTEVSDAYSQDRALNLNGLVADDGQMSVEMLWENVHFRPEDQYIGEIILNTGTGYQMRNIPLQVLPQDDGSSPEYKEAVINFNRAGKIESVYFSIQENTYKQIMEKGVQLKDMERRMQILDYVERFRTSYNQRDLNFLNQVFSDDALIITGNVVKPRAKKTDGLTLTLPQVKYTKQNKQQYLSKLQGIFKNVRYINVEFDDVQIRRHGANPDIYGVRVVQNWNTSSYSDEGYVFMVWDFTEPDRPQIHVRAWQPMYLDNGKTQRLPEEEIFDLNSIEGI